jgi:hypothetical protein
VGNIDAQFLEGADGMGAGRLAFQSADARRHDTAIRPSTRGVTEQPFGHRAATNIPCAYEQNGLHSGDNASKPCGGRRQTSTAKICCFILKEKQSRL